MKAAAIRHLQLTSKSVIVTTCLGFTAILAHPWMTSLFTLPQALIATLGLMLVSLALLALLCVFPCPSCREPFAGRLSHVPTPFAHRCRYCGESLEH